MIRLYCLEIVTDEYKNLHKRMLKLLVEDHELDQEILRVDNYAIDVISRFSNKLILK